MVIMREKHVVNEYLAVEEIYSYIGSILEKYGKGIEVPNISKRIVDTHMSKIVENNTTKITGWQTGLEKVPYYEFDGLYGIHSFFNPDTVKLKKSLLTEDSVRDMHKAIWILEVYSSSLPHYTSFLEMTMNILFTNDTSKYIGSPLYELYARLFYVYSNEIGDIESKCHDIVFDFIGKNIDCASRIRGMFDGDLDSFESYEDDFVSIELYDENVLEDGKVELLFSCLNKIDGSNTKETIILE